MSLDFVELFSSLGLDHLTEHCFLYLIGGDVSEECAVKEACAVSSTWNSAICKHVFATKQGEGALQQRRIEAELDLKRLTARYVAGALSDGKRVLRAAIADAFIEAIQDGSKDALRKVYGDHGPVFVEELVRCNLTNEFFILLLVGGDYLIPMSTWQHLLWAELPCCQTGGQEEDLCLFLRGVLRANHCVFRVAHALLTVSIVVGD